MADTTLFGSETPGITAANILVGSPLITRSGGIESQFPISELYLTPHFQSAIASNAVTSFIGRTGAVFPMADDYSKSQINGLRDSDQVLFNGLVAVNYLETSGYLKLGDFIGAAAGGYARYNTGRLQFYNSAWRTLAIAGLAGEYSKSQVTGIADTDNVTFGGITTPGNINALSVKTNNANALKKFVVYEETASSTEHTFYGIGTESFATRYQAGASGKHVFYSAIDSASSKKLVTIDASGFIQRLPTSAPADSLIEDGFISLFSNGGVISGRTNVGGTYTTTALGIGSNIAVSGYLGAGITGSATSLLQVGAPPTQKGVFSLNNGFVATKARASIYAFSNNGGSTPASYEPVLLLGREGVSTQSYANFAYYSLARYEVSGASSRTGLSLKLAHGDLGNTPEGDSNPEIMRWLSGGWTVFNLPTAAPADAQISAGQVALFSNSGVISARTNVSGTYATTALSGGGGSPSYLTQSLLNLGDTIGGTLKAAIIANTTANKGATAFYDSSAGANCKLFVVSKGTDTTFNISRAADDGSSFKQLLTVIPDASDINKNTVLIGGSLLYLPRIMATSNTVAPTNSQNYNIKHADDGTFIIVRLNDAGSSVIDTPFKLSPISSSASNLYSSGNIIATGFLQGTYLTLFAGGTSAYANIKNTSAAANTGSWKINVASTDGAIEILPTDDVGANGPYAIRAERGLSGSTPTITAVRRAGGGASFDLPSDENFKEQIEDVCEESSLAMIVDFPINSFIYKDEYAKKFGCTEGERRIGTIAQAAREVCCDAVKEHDDGLSVNIDPIFWNALNAIKNIAKRLDNIESELNLQH